MNREAFCSLLEAEYQHTRENWFQTTQQFGPPALVWNWLHVALEIVQDPHKQIITYLLDIYLQRFQRLKDRLDYLSEREVQLSRAISTLESSFPYYHLSHFEEGEFQQYYTDGIEPVIEGDY